MGKRKKIIGKKRNRRVNRAFNQGNLKVCGARISGECLNQQDIRRAQRLWAMAGLRWPDPPWLILLWMQSPVAFKQIEQQNSVEGSYAHESSPPSMSICDSMVEYLKAV